MPVVSRLVLVSAEGWDLVASFNIHWSVIGPGLSQKECWNQGALFYYHAIDSGMTCYGACLVLSIMKVLLRPH